MRNEVYPNLETFQKQKQRDTKEFILPKLGSVLTVTRCDIF